LEGQSAEEEPSEDFSSSLLVRGELVKLNRPPGAAGGSPRARAKYSGNENSGDTAAGYFFVRRDGALP
jgi:hypothetical protein